MLELRFDGPIPALAVVDLRACPPRPFAIAMLPDAALAHWQSLAMRNLKAEQQRLADGPVHTLPHACSVVFAPMRGGQGRMAGV